MQPLAPADDRRAKSPEGKGLVRSPNCDTTTELASSQRNDSRDDHQDEQVCKGLHAAEANRSGTARFCPALSILDALVRHLFGNKGLISLFRLRVVSARLRR
jgi:hypothetical protein